MMRPPVVTIGDSPEGLVELKVRNGQDHRIGFFQIDAAAMDDELRGAIERWQQRHDHAVLTIIRPSVQSA